MENIDIYDSLLLQIENLDEYNEDRIEIYKKQAEQGDYKAQYKLGEKYYKGFELERDLDEADRLFTSSYRICSMRGDDPDALYYIFLMNFNGYGIPKNNERAFDFCKKSAELGCDDAKFQLAIMYFNGYGVQQNYLEAIKLLEELSKFKKENVSANAKFFLGLLYKTLIENKNKFLIKNVKKYIKESDKNFKGCIKFYENKAKQSDSLSQFRLGYIYLNGLGVKKDTEKALELFKKSAELGYSDSEYQLGKNFYFGSESLIYLEKSASKGNLQALYELGKIYQYGFFVDYKINKDYKKSIEYYIKSAEFGYNEANNKLDSFISYDDYYKKFCSNYYKKIYKEEKTIEQVYATFFEYFEKLAEKGSAFALYRLGQMYENGVGIDIDNKKAFELYKKSAKLGYARAQYALGRMYEVCNFIEHDENEALYWYHKATLGGYDYLSNIDEHYKDESASSLAQKAINKIEEKNKVFSSIFIIKFLKNMQLLDYSLNLGKKTERIFNFFLCVLLNLNLDLDDFNSLYLKVKNLNIKIFQDDSKIIFSLYLLSFYIYIDDKKILNMACYNLALFFLKNNSMFKLKIYRYVNSFYKAINIKYKDIIFTIGIISKNDFENIINNDNYNIAITFYAISSYLGNAESKIILENIALQNNSLAQYYIGNMYLKGLSEKQDYDKAIGYLSNSGQQGNILAQLTLAALYSDRIFLEEKKVNNIELNYDKAIYWYSEAVKQENKQAFWGIANIYDYEKRDYNQAITWYNKLLLQSKKNMKEKYKFDIIEDIALYRLGEIYKDIKKDYNQAIESYLKLAEQPEIRYRYIKEYKYKAQYRLGEIYKDIKKDYNQAIYWFKKNIKFYKYYESGTLYKKVGNYKMMRFSVYIESHYQLIFIYKNIKKDYKKVICLCLTLIKQGDVQAQYELGFMYEKGLGVKKNYTKAVEYYKKASENGSDLASYRLGEIYSRGLGTSKNINIANKYFVLSMAICKNLF